MRTNRPLSMTALASFIACYMNVAPAAQGDLPQGQGDSNVERTGQDPAVSSTEESPADSGATQRADATTEGIRAGSFVLYPQVTVSATYDDNIYATRTNEDDDLVMSVAPSIQMKSDWERHVFNVQAGTAISRYRDHGSEDTEDYWVEAEGRYDLTDRTNAFGGVRYARYHEDRDSPDAVLSTEPTLYMDNLVYAGVSHRFNERVSARVGGSLRKLDFDDAGNLNNDDRDRDVITGGVWLGYDLDKTTQLFAQAALDQRDYDAALDDGIPENRDSDGYRLQAGVKFKRGTVSGDAYAGYMEQDYDDATLKDVSAPDFGASLAWKATERTTVRGVLERSIEETTLNGASSYLNTGVSAGVSHKARPDLTLAASVGYNHADYQGSSRDDDFVEANAGITYDITRRVFLAAKYRYVTRDSNVDIEEFQRNQVSLTLGTYLYPRRQLPPSWERYAYAIDPATENQLGGFYIGLQAGHDNLATNTFRRTAPNDQDDAYFLGDGILYGAFAGYGWTRDRWYLGVEVDAEHSDADWYHDKSKPNAPTFSVDKDDSFGGSLRLGRVLDNGVLAYARAGAVRTEFNTLYDNTDATPPDTLVDKTFEETGTRFGVGIEVPEGDHLFWRMDYAYTDYGSYDIDYGNATEQYSNADSALRLGIGYRFDKQLDARAKPVNIDHSGFYAGINVSHGGLGSDIDGIHREDVGVLPGDPEYTFDVDFGTHGVGGGLFAGYGKTSGKWYLGVEVDAEVSQAKWEHIRVVGSPNGGRDFSVAKHDSYGISGRLGYTLRSGTLVYARAGAVRTKFQTIYNRGNNSANWVDRDDRVDGFRYGIGADVPMTRDLMLRLDYSYTDYDDYGFRTNHGPGGSRGDNMEYANWESLFRLGVATRF